MNKTAKSLLKNDLVLTKRHGIDCYHGNDLCMPTIIKFLESKKNDIVIIRIQYIWTSNYSYFIAGENTILDYYDDELSRELISFDDFISYLYSYYPFLAYARIELLFAEGLVEIKCIRET